MAEESFQNFESLEQRVEAATKLIGNIDEERSAYNQSVGNLVELVEQSVRQKQAESERHEAIVKEILAENDRLKDMISKLLSAAETHPTNARSNEVSVVQGRLTQLLETANIDAPESAEVVSISSKQDEVHESDVGALETEGDADTEGDAETVSDVDETEAAVLAAMNGALAAMNETAPGPAMASEAARAKGKRAKGGGSWFGS